MITRTALITTILGIALTLTAVAPLLAQEGEGGDLEDAEQARLLRLMKTAPPAPNPPSRRYYSETESLDPAQRATVAYDPASGRVQVTPAGELRAPWDPLPPDPPWFGASSGDSGDVEVRAPEDITPTPPTPHSNNTGYPWRTIHKLLMRYNVGGTNYYYSCSAWAAGSFHVVTAGHCIYSWDPNDDGSDADRKWADEIWVWAGQGDAVQPIGDEDVDPDWPYGEAKEVWMRSYSGWTDYQNHSHDWGVITLNRRDGDHTGWMGRESDCADSLNFSGYPTETPYVPDDTVVQYYGYDADNVDYCWVNRIGLDAYIYGGHSGGPSWRYDTASGNRYVEGIHSTSDRSGDAEDTRLTDDKRADLNSYMSSDETIRPPVARPDLGEYYFDGNARKDLVDTEVHQGETFQVEYNVFNSGFATSSSFTVTFFLSSNTWISTGDHAIGTRTHSLGAWTLANQIATLTVPTSVPAGDYYVGWIMSGGATEYSTNNNSVVITGERLTVLPERKITVSQPNGGETVYAGSATTIAWTSTDAGSFVRIELSRNSGGSWSTLTSSTANDGSYSWTPTGPASVDCRVRITSTSYPAVSDISNSDFRIVDRTITVADPNGAEIWYTGTTETISWTSTDAGSYVALAISRDSGASWSTISASTPNDGAYAWTVSGETSSRCRVRVTSTAYPSVSDTSNSDFTITERRITVISPNGGEFWRRSTPQTISWTAWNVGTTVMIQISRDSGSSWFTVTSSTANDGSYTYTPTLAGSTHCRIRITSISYPSISDVSDADFTLGDQSITVLEPNGGEDWAAGSTHLVRWTSESAGAAVVIEGSADAGSSWETLAASTANDGELVWTLGDLTSDQCLVRVTSVEYPDLSDTSDGVFSIEWAIFFDGFESGGVDRWSSATP